jgi:hypothetical protein
MAPPLAWSGALDTSVIAELFVPFIPELDATRERLP